MQGTVKRNDKFYEQYFDKIIPDMIMDLLIQDFEKYQLIIDKINEISPSCKVGIYSYGDKQTDFFFETTNILEKNIVCIINYDGKFKDNYNVNHSLTECMDDIDLLVVTTSRYQKFVTDIIYKQGFNKEVMTFYTLGEKTFNTIRVNDGVPFYRELTVEEFNIIKKIYYRENDLSTLPQALLKVYFSRIIDSFCYYTQKHTEVAVNYKMYPLYDFIEENHSNDCSRELYNDVAIVIQGPVQENFTIQSIVNYKKMYPGIKIIISTWKDEKLELKDGDIENVYVVRSELPDNDKINTKKQLLSTFEGIKKAKELDTTYVLKLRSDMRIFSKTIILEMMNILKNNIAGCPRICASLYEIISEGIYIYDYWSFGTVDDMESFWQVDGIEEYFNASNTELMLTNRWLKRNETYIKNCSFYEMTDRLFEFIDIERLSMCWNKYNNWCKGTSEKLNAGLLTTNKFDYDAEKEKYAIHKSASVTKTVKDS